MKGAVKAVLFNEFGFESIGHCQSKFRLFFAALCDAAMVGRSAHLCVKALMAFL
jgi:hypothetical protein